MKSVRERMDINAAYREVGTYRGAAEICGTTDKTVKRVVAGAERAGNPTVRHNYDDVARPRRRARHQDQGPDLGQAAAAGGDRRRLFRLGAEFPPSGRRGQGGVAIESPPGSASWGVGAG